MQVPQWLQTMSEKVKSFFETYPEIFIFLIISIGVLLSIKNISVGNTIDADEIKKHYNEAELKIQDRLKESPRLDSINLCKNLKTIHSYIGDLKKSKIYLATTYQKFLIICFTIGIFFITLTAVIAFVVTKKGWDNSSRKRKGLLLTSAFYGLLLTAYPKLFDQDENYKTNFTDYTALSKAQLYIFVRLNPYLDKHDNTLNKTDSVALLNAMDTATTVLMQHANIDISLDKKQLEMKTIDLSK